MKPTYDLSALFAEYKNKVYHLALSLSKNAADADDITQNTFIQIFKHIDSFKGNAKISTWIYRITVNEALQARRKKKREYVYAPIKPEQDKTAEDGDEGRSHISPRLGLPDEHVVADELNERISAVIQNMDVKYRLPLLLNELGDCSITESADILHISVNAFKTRLHRAREQVKSALRDYYRDRELRYAKIDRCERCSYYMGFVYRYIFDTLDKKARIAFEHHIGDCAPCQGFFSRYSDAIAVTKGLECHDIPSALQDRIATFINEK